MKIGWGLTSRLLGLSIGHFRNMSQCIGLARVAGIDNGGLGSTARARLGPRGEGVAALIDREAVTLLTSSPVSDD